MTSEETARLAAGRDIWVSMGIAVSAVSAGFSSFAGLRSLAEATGWAVMAPLFALCVDAYALTAIRVWLATSTRSSHARIFAKRNAIGAILLSLAGNAVWHLIAAGLLSVTWHIVMAVGAVPPVILGLVSHLAVIRRQVDPVVTSRASGTEAVLPPALRTVPSTVPSPVLESVPDDIAANRQVGKTKTLPRHRSASSGRQKRPRYGSEAELLAAAREADAAYRAAHGGKAITRDELRRALRISGERATAALRHLRAKDIEHEQSSDREEPMQ